MSDKKYVVPEKMWNAAHEAHCQYNGGAASDGSITMAILEAAIRWLSENPRVPTEKQIHAMIESLEDGSPVHAGIIEEWQKVMFLAPEPEVPDAVKDLMWGSGSKNAEDDAFHNRDVIEAYKRGKAGK